MGDTREFGEPQISRSVWVMVMRDVLEERMAGYWQAVCGVEMCLCIHFGVK